ncbi:type IV pilus secretin PilQ [Thermodesulfobacteriota bacterium]
MNDKQIYMIKMLGFFLVLIVCFPGCTEKNNLRKDPLYEKWQAKAETSRGYSPAPKRHATDTTRKSVTTASPQETSGTEKNAEISADNFLPTNKISLTMHDIDLAVLLRAMAKAADQNIMINEKVEGKANINITEAPWDQVFLGILRTHGLTYSWEGSIIRIMTLEDMEQDLKRESQKKGFKMVEPLKTLVVKISYTEAKKMRENLETFLSKNDEGQPLGSVMVDEHTNSLIIQAIQEDIDEIVQLIEDLDRPIPQILIEAHVVEASKTTAMQLGVQWGGLSKNGFWVTPGLNSSGVLGGTVDTPIDPTSGFASNFPAQDVTNTLGMTIGFAVQDVGSSVLAAQLSALQKDGKLNILSSPSITTLDNHEALIESGSEIPYQTVEDGEVKIEFKKAVLSLIVTPHVIDGETLKLLIKTRNDEVDETRATESGNPALTTKVAETNVLLFDGQTTVIGGLSKIKTLRNVSGVPALKDIPLLGWLFKTNEDADEFEDLLIFITPHVLKERKVKAGQDLPAQTQPPADSSSNPEAIPK